MMGKDALSVHTDSILVVAFVQLFPIHAALMMRKLETAMTAILDITYQKADVCKETHSVNKPIFMDVVSDAMMNMS